MNKKTVNPIVQWWMGPNLPYQDIYELPSLINKSTKDIHKFRFSQWFIHPIKRRIARYYLKFLQHFTDIKVIGVTGSAGKTTSVQMIESILKLKDKTVASAVGIDPVYNIPNTILRSTLTTKYLILEMGVEYPGEMDFYLWLAKPDIGVITNIFPTHTEFFGDEIGVLKEKSKLVKTLTTDGDAILNSDSIFLKKLDGNLKAKPVWFGSNGNIKISNIKINSDLKTEFLINHDEGKIDSIHVRLNQLGRLYAYNAGAAVGVSKALGFSIEDSKKGLELIENAPHRMEVIKHKSGAIIVDDSYNNNPEAAKEALRNFAEAAGGKTKTVIFGDMKELGEKETEYHAELGKFMAKEPIKITDLICIGQASRVTAEASKITLGKDHVWFFGDFKAAVPVVKKMLAKNVYVLVKGSRSLGLDKLIKEL